jgi:hypothetical protein
MNLSRPREPGVSTEEVSGVAGQNLTAAFRWLLLGIALPLFIAIILLAVKQYGSQHKQVLQLLTQTSATYAIVVEDFAKSARDHVLRLRDWS